MIAGSLFIIIDRYLSNRTGDGNRQSSGRIIISKQNIGYCRLKNLTVGYTLPRQWTRKALIESLRIYFTGENLFTWSGIRSDYIDPEMAATNGNLRLYPWQRTYMFGVDVTF